MNWQALILAGQRPGGQDAVADAAGVKVKALAPVGDCVMLKRVYNALSALDEFTNISVIGHAALLKQHRDFADISNITWVQQQQPSPSLSVLAHFQSIEKSGPLLITTGDHALLQSDWVSFFLKEAEKSGADLVAGVANFKQAEKKIYGKRTLYRLKDGAFSGCNLFALMTPKAERLLTFWKDMEDLRKKPLRVISVFGIGMVMRFLLGNLTLAHALTLASSRLNCRLSAVVLPDPKAAIDVDHPNDWQLAQRLVAEATTEEGK